MILTFLSHIVTLYFFSAILKGKNFFIRISYEGDFMKKILLHMCCAPCSCYCVKRLRELDFEPVGFFFNPNIHPYQEWRKRLNSARDFAQKMKMELHVINHYGLRDFLNKTFSVVESLENPDTFKNPDGHHNRCKICYAWRLNETAKFAKENNFEIFTSSLFYSIHQNHELMKKIAEISAKNFDIKFFYEDFRAGWQEGIDLSLELELYRQNYCGCIFSEEERFSKDLKKIRRANKFSQQN